MDVVIYDIFSVGLFWYSILEVYMIVNIYYDNDNYIY